MSTRVIFNFAGSTLACFLAFTIGTAHSQSACEADIEATDCDVAVLDGFVWLLLAIGLCVVVVTILELVQTSSKSRSAAAADPPAKSR